MGKTGVATDVECQFKAANKKVPIFITNIHSETSENDIVNYIRSKTGNGVSKENTHEERKGDIAYKFLVSESKLY